MSFIRLLPVLLMLFMISACGQKGSLYLEESPGQHPPDLDSEQEKETQRAKS